MTLTTIILQILLTIPLTIILNYFKKEENRRINQLIIPSLYIIIISALIPSVKENIFLIVVFEIFIRNFYITNIVNGNNEIKLKIEQIADYFDESQTQVEYVKRIGTPVEEVIGEY